MARQIRDVALALDAVVGPDPTDLRSLPMPDVAWSAVAGRAARASPGGLVARRSATPSVDREVRAVCERGRGGAGGAGHRGREIETVFDEDPGHDWLTLTSTYNLRVARATPRTRRVGRSSTRRMVALDRVGAVVGAGRGHRARRSTRGTTLNLRLVELFHDVSLLLTPTVAGQTPGGRRSGHRRRASPTPTGFASPTRST